MYSEENSERERWKESYLILQQWQQNQTGKR